MTNLEVVKELYRAFAAKDQEQLTKIIAEDVQWIQCDGFPGGDHRQGRQAVFDKVFSALKSEWVDFKAEVDEYLDAGDTIVVTGAYTGTHSQTQQQMRSVFAHVYDLSQGQIVRYRQFADTAPMVKAATLMP